MMQHEVILEWDAAEAGDSIAPSNTEVSFAPSALAQTITDGRIVGWLLVDELVFEDFGLPVYEGEDFQLDEVEVRSVDAIAGTVSIRAVLRIELDPSVPLETEAHLSDLYNALTGAIQVFYWTGEGESSHPDQAIGIFGMSGEINYVQINGRVVHERRAPKEYNLVLVPDIDFETGAFSSPTLSEAELLNTLAAATSTEFYVEVEFLYPKSEQAGLCFYLSPNCGGSDSEFDVKMGEQDLSAKIKLHGSFKIPVKSSAVGEVESLGDDAALVPMLVVFRRFDESTKTWVRATAAIAEDKNGDCDTWCRIANWKLEKR